jgi:DNA modification methylase
MDKTAKRSAVVLDLFGGSGSTLVACEKTGRKARLMELDPRYADVIVKRWQDFTGQRATLESSGRTFQEVADDRRTANDNAEATSAAA